MQRNVWLGSTTLRLLSTLRPHSERPAPGRKSRSGSKGEFAGAERTCAFDPFQTFSILSHVAPTPMVGLSKS